VTAATHLHFTIQLLTSGPGMPCHAAQCDWHGRPHTRFQVFTKFNYGQSQPNASAFARLIERTASGCRRVAEPRPKLPIKPLIPAPFSRRRDLVMMNAIHWLVVAFVLSGMAVQAQPVSARVPKLSFCEAEGIHMLPGLL
jgi:hypothetical protein